VTKRCGLLFFLLCIAGSCCAQTVSHSIAQLDCGPARPPRLQGPTSKQQREQITATWLGPNELKVEAWDDQTAESRIDPSTAKVVLEGSTIVISYFQRAVDLKGVSHIPDCLFPVKLSFIVLGIPRSRYEVRVEGGAGTVHPIVVDG